VTVKLDEDSEVDHDISVPFATQIGALGLLAKFWMVAVAPWAFCEMITRHGTPLDPQVGVQVFLEHVPGAAIAELTNTANTNPKRATFLQTKRLSFMAFLSCG
jgi:predicted thioesterase